MTECWDDLFQAFFPAFYFYVTAKTRAKSIDNGNNARTASAIGQSPKAIHQEAFITIKESTPAFTAFPIKGPTGFCIALYNGRPISHACKRTKGSAKRIFPCV